MRKLTALLISILIALSISACSSHKNADQVSDNQIMSEDIISSKINDSVITDDASTDITTPSESTANGSGAASRSGMKNNSQTNTSSSKYNSTAASSPITTQPFSTRSYSETNKPTVKPSATANPSAAAPVTTTPEAVVGKTLIVYFSWSSNTEEMANTIKEQTGGDIFELIPVTAYPTDYTACTEVALAERDSNARPAIQNLPASVEEYDNILIGFPIWWHTAPMIIGTFLENYDLTGVNVYPFSQSASMNREQFNNAMEFVRECSKNAIVHDGLFARYSDTNSIISYLKNNNLTK